jgi:tetratricopeptide (TPR) repeat protein
VRVAVSSQDERARLIAQTLKSLPPGSLALAAGQLPGQLGKLMRALDDATAAADPVAAVQAVLGALPSPDTDALAAVLKDVGAAMAAGMDSAGKAVAEAVPADELARLARNQARLAEVGAAIRPGISDATLGALVDRSLGLLGESGPLSALIAAATAVGDVAGSVSRFAEALRTDPVAAAKDPGLQAVIGRLQGQREHVAAAAAQLSDVVEIVSGVRAWAASRGDSATRAQLAAAEAGLRQARNPEDPVIFDRLREVFDAAIDAGLLPLAREAGRRLQLRQLGQGTLEGVAGIAFEVAELAARLGDREAEVGARGEQALVLAQLPRRQEEAKATAAAAAALAAGSEDPVLRLRGQLLLGQVREKTGDLPGARSVFRKVMDAGKSDARQAHTVAWAALHLGRLERAEGQRGRARRDLELAWKVGRASGDWALYVYAAGARVELASDEDDRATADAVLRDLDVTGPRIGGAGAGSARAEIAQRIRARWG